MLQIKFKPKWACGFDLSLKEMLSESIGRQQETMDKVTFSIILIVLKCLRLYTKFQGHCSIGTGEEDF